MTKRIQTVQTLGAMALVFVLQACGGGNMPAISGSAGSSGTGTAGSTGSGGSTGEAGSSGVGGTTGTGGSAAGGTTGAFGEPACLSTVSKGASCTPTDQQFCYKTCGPERTGVKTEMCTSAGIYAEMSGCSFDNSKDYSCYKIPSAANTQCPAGTPMGSAACDVPHCVLCNSLQGLTGGQYSDSTGAPKVGWCTCQEPNSAGLRTWTCASDTAWPCPFGAGC
jgi:hypothetical protein